MLPLGAFESSLRGKGPVAVAGVPGVVGLGLPGHAPAAPRQDMNGIHKSCTGRAHGHGIQKIGPPPPPTAAPRNGQQQQQPPLEDSDDTDSGQESLSANASSCDSRDGRDGAPSEQAEAPAVPVTAAPAPPPSAPPGPPGLEAGTVKRMKRVQRVAQHVAHGTLRRAVSAKLPLTATEESANGGQGAATAASPAKKSTIPIRREASMSLDRSRKASLPNGNAEPAAGRVHPPARKAASLATPPKAPLQRKASLGGGPPGTPNPGPLARKPSVGSLSRGPSHSNLAVLPNKKAVVVPARPKTAVLRGASGGAPRPVAFTNVASWEELSDLAEALRPGGGHYKTLDQLLEVSDRDP